MAGRLLGLIPDVETFKPMLDTALGIGGYWNLPHDLLLARGVARKAWVATNR